MLGGMREPDEDWITYTFIRARLLDSSGKRLHWRFLLRQGYGGTSRGAAHQSR